MCTQFHHWIDSACAASVTAAAIQVRSRFRTDPSACASYYAETEPMHACNCPMSLTRHPCAQGMLLGLASTTVERSALRELNTKNGKCL
eukprot:7168681-Prymnesium_polylepis.2